MSRQGFLIVALLVSLAVNLLVAGVVLGHWHHRDSRPPPMAWATDSLTEETRQIVRQRMRSQFPKVRPLREAMRSAVQDVRQAAGAEPFDPAAMNQALEAMREVTAQYQDLMQENAVELAAQLPAEQRLALLRAVLQRLHMARMPAGPKRPDGQRWEHGEKTPPRPVQGPTSQR